MFLPVKTLVELELGGGQAEVQKGTNVVRGEVGSIGQKLVYYTAFVSHL